MVEDSKRLLLLLNAQPNTTRAVAPGRGGASGSWEPSTPIPARSGQTIAMQPPPRSIDDVAMPPRGGMAGSLAALPPRTIWDVPVHRGGASGSWDMPAQSIQPVSPPAPSNLAALSQRGGLSVMDQGGGGSVEGNVAALNRQTEALRSLREARNPGVTTGQAGAFGDLVSIGRAGEGYGDEAMRAERIRSMVEGAGNRGLTRSQRTSMLTGAQALAEMNQDTGPRRLQSQPEPDPYKMGQLDLDRQRLGLSQQQFGLERQKAALDAIRQGTRDERDEMELANKSRYTPDQIKAELMRRYLSGGKDSDQALLALQQLFPAQNDILAGLKLDN